MTIVRFLILMLSVSALVACTSGQRAPSSVSYDDQRANRIQEIDVELSKYWNDDWRLGQKLFQVNPSGAMTSSKPTFDSSKYYDPKIRPMIDQLLRERQDLIEQLSSKMNLREWSGIGPWFEATFRQRLFEKEETIAITDLNEFLLSRPVQTPFPLEQAFFEKYTLRFKNMIPVEDIPFAKDKDERQRKKFLKARLECNGDITYKSDFFFLPNKTSRVYEFDWYFNKENNQSITVQFAPSVTSCQFKYYNPEYAKTWTNGFALGNLLDLSTEWLKLSQQIDICARPQGAFGKNPDGFFWQQDFNFTTCPETFEKYVNLRDPYTSMNRKVISLTGSPLNRRDFDNKNPMASLDFSKAPKFDIIWVSSLNFSADFSGMILSRALRYHGEQGTQIRILVPQVTMTRKDREIVQWLMRDLPNIKVQYYKYSVTDDKDGTWFDRFHRVNHTKLLIGRSTKNPADDFLITGGRNIRDSYIFPETPVYRAYKYLKSYGDGEESYIYYNDFEIELRGTKFIQSVLSQMLNFWMRDPETQRFRSTNINIPAEATATQVERLKYLPNLNPVIRHIVSLPYFDGYQLERFYIEMIDSAQSELLLTTPYFRPSEAISAALDRAHNRGVKIKVITRIHLAGDGTPQIAEDVNKQGINRHLKNIDIYEWTEVNSIMHAKILVIDKRLSFISSVNLNRRSFIHDTESGVLILHEKTALDFRNEALSYINKGRRISAEEKISWINGTLIDWADSYF